MSVAVGFFGVFNIYLAVFSIITAKLFPMFVVYGITMTINAGLFLAMACLAWRGYIYD